MPGPIKMETMENNIYGNCRPVDSYQKLGRIGEGTYGTVYKGKDRVSGKMVALKRVLLHNESEDGFPITSLREICNLRRCSTHENCVQLIEVVVGIGRESVFLVFEYCEHDLYSLTKNYPAPFNEAETKSLILQLLSAVKFLHGLSIIHRDLKLSNILYNNQGVLKLCDFGLSRTFTKSPEKMTTKVVTLWYRCPELLLGAESYGTAIDVWALGCVMAELLLHKPFLPGDNELDQIHYIFDVMGCPTSQVWPDLSDMPLIRNGTISLEKERAKNCYNNIRVLIKNISEEGFDLLNGLLALDPKKRTSAEYAECHPYFATSPYPQDKALMPTFPTQHLLPLPPLPPPASVSASTSVSRGAPPSSSSLSATTAAARSSIFGSSLASLKSKLMAKPTTTTTTISQHHRSSSSSASASEEKKSKKKSSSSHDETDGHHHKHRKHSHKSSRETHRNSPSKKSKHH